MNTFSFRTILIFRHFNFFEQLSNPNILFLTNFKFWPNFEFELFWIGTNVKLEQFSNWNNFRIGTIFELEHFFELEQFFNLDNFLDLNNFYSQQLLIWKNIQIWIFLNLNNFQVYTFFKTDNKNKKRSYKRSLPWSAQLECPRACTKLVIPNFFSDIQNHSYFIFLKYVNTMEKRKDKP
jgi:hypothetical protein